MGFFSDLKEDLFQSLNATSPEDEKIKGKTAQTGVNAETGESGAESVEEESTEGMPAEILSEDISESQEAEPVAEAAKEDPEGAETVVEANTTRVAVNEISVITAGMVVKGDITTEGSIDIFGTVNGNIDALGHLSITGHVNGNLTAAEINAEGAKICGEIISEGAVKVDPGSVIFGNITATSAIIAGAVKGDIDVRGPVVLEATAIVMGNIKSKSVQISASAGIEGTCSQCYADVCPSAFFEEYKA